MSMNRYAGSGPIMAGLAAMIEDREPNRLVQETVVPYVDRVFSYPGLSDIELRRMIENLADQLANIAAQNVEMRERIAKLEGSHQAWTPWGAGIDRFNVSFD